MHQPHGAVRITSCTSHDYQCCDNITQHLVPTVELDGQKVARGFSHHIPIEYAVKGIILIVNISKLSQQIIAELLKNIQLWLGAHDTLAVSLNAHPA